MFWRDLNFWNTIFEIAPYALVFISALAGGASSFIKEGHPFRIGAYLFEVVSSITAGFIVYLALKTTKTPIELINAIAALAAYFGTKMLSIFYQVFILKLKKALKLQDEELNEPNDKEVNHD